MLQLSLSHILDN